jgi:hypothetical protein
MTLQKSTTPAPSAPGASESFTVLETGHIDGGAYRVVRLADGSERVEGWSRVRPK